MDNFDSSFQYIVIKALDDGVKIIGMTRGTDTKFLHTENLNKNEVIVAQFTENISAVKIIGEATVMTNVGTIQSGV